MEESGTPSFSHFTIDLFDLFSVPFVHNWAVAKNIKKV